MSSLALALQVRAGHIVGCTSQCRVHDSECAQEMVQSETKRIKFEGDKLSWHGRAASSSMSSATLLSPGSMQSEQADSRDVSLGRSKGFFCFVGLPGLRILDFMLLLVDLLGCEPCEPCEP